MHLFFLIFSIYLIALCPTIYVGDSALLTAASFSLGTAHPPGYPLYVLIGKLITFLPLGSVAFKLNLMSSLFGALTATIIFRIVLYLTENRYAAWASALFFAFVPVFWVESSKAEVYSLNAFICSVIFFLTLKIIKKDGSFHRQLFLIAFLIGLGMGNHHTVPLMGLAAIPVIVMRWRELRFRWLLFMMLFFITGISVNLLIYIRSGVALTSGTAFLYSYGGSFENLIKVFLRKGYDADTVAALKGTSNIFSNFFAANINVLKYIIIPNIKYGIPFILLGLFKTFGERRLFIYIISLFFFWITFLGNITAGGSLTEEDIQIISVYYIPLFSIISVIVGLGIALILEKAHLLWKRSFIPGFLAYTAIVFSVCLTPHAYGVVSSVQHTLAYTFARDMLTVLPVKSMLLHYNDNPTFTSFYIQSVERFRDDILIMNTGGKKDDYGLESAPQWKYGVFYPEFYKTQKTKVSYFDREFALRGKLYTSNPKNMTEIIKGHYSYRIQPLTALLYPKEYIPDEDKIDKLYLNAYDFLDYESIRKLPCLDDFLATEIVNHYALSLIIYGDIMNKRGEKEISKKAMKESFTLGDSKNFLGPYIKYLMNNGRAEDALLFLRKFQKGESERDSAIAHILEYKLLSVTGQKEEADKKYKYIKEKDLLPVINARF